MERRTLLVRRGVERKWSGGEDTAGVWRRGGPSKGGVFCGAVRHDLAAVSQFEPSAKGFQMIHIRLVKSGDLV
jgi:hypothetical protein